MSLKWQSFFNLRKSRRSWERNGMLLGGLSSFFGASYYFGAVRDFDPLQPIFGMDPHLVFGGACIVSGAAGAVISMTSTGSVWRLLQNKNILKQLDQRETDFFHRIAAKRPKQIKTNLQHPLPDYYGEKIESVADYRHWLRNVNQWSVKMGVSRK